MGTIGTDPMTRTTMTMLTWMKLGTLTKMNRHGVETIGIASGLTFRSGTTSLAGLGRKRRLSLRNPR